MLERSSGILLHVSSLPSPYGIGTLGSNARKFVDFLKESGQTYWQVLPLVPTGFGDSPYQSCSSAAGNPYFIDPDTLFLEGLLSQDDLPDHDPISDPDHVNFENIYFTRFNILRKAFERSKPFLSNAIYSFVEQERSWLADYALFMALKSHFGTALSQWPDQSIKRREPEAISKYSEMLSEEIEFHYFMQYEFFRQWGFLKEYANSNGIKIIGDIPFYVSDDSVDVWVNKNLFELKQSLSPRLIAGVPPDYYSEDGQMWGNPIYKWTRHEETNFAWWKWRLSHSLKLFDLLRIDHFRAVHSYWEIPAAADTAAAGKMRRGPGRKLLDALEKEIDFDCLIIENLCGYDPRLFKFFEECKLPGMTVLVFAFNAEDNSAYLPHNANNNSVAYTSTHDSATFAEWLESANSHDREFACDYLRLRTDEGASWGAIKTVWASAASLSIAPMQDILGLGGDSRMNTPATLGGTNWQWRIRADALNPEVSSLLHRITKTYRRLIYNESPCINPDSGEL